MAIPAQPTNGSVKRDPLLACGSHHQVESTIEFRQFRGTLDCSLAFLFRDKTRQTGVSPGFLGRARIKPDILAVCFYVRIRLFGKTSSSTTALAASAERVAPWVRVFPPSARGLKKVLRAALL
jgi:hypothetical protein